MIVIFAALTGAIVGAVTAIRRKGSALDIAQYTGSYGIAFALIGLIATVVIHRLAV